MHVCLRMFVCFETPGSSLQRKMHELNHRQGGAQRWPFGGFPDEEGGI